MNTSAEGLSTAIQKQRLLISRLAVESLPAFDRVVAALPALIERLKLGSFVSTVIIDDKPRVLYRFLVTKESPAATLGPTVILKVYGDQPRGEGPLQQLWRSRNLNVPRLICGEEDGCSWLALEQLELRPLSTRPQDQLKLVDQLALAGSVMHSPQHQLTMLLRPLDQIMLPRWQTATNALRQAGYTVPSWWLNKAASAYAKGNQVPLHGDLAPSNMGVLSDGKLVVFDASALYGAPSFDAARWSARVGTSTVGPAEIFEHWTNTEKLPLEPASWALLAAECVLEAGSREIVRSRHAQNNNQTTDHDVENLLTVASRHWN
ncbi:MAG: hypothetical protein JWM61_1150 [Micrococcaceae bacterium]|nr:hypothetical protein [Micrococcaceae bacterium]